MNWSARGNVLNQYLRNTSIGTTVKYQNVYRLLIFRPPIKTLLNDNTNELNANLPKFLGLYGLFLLIAIV